MNNYKLSKGCKYILKKLNDRGYEAYTVGGSVRDLLLGLDPTDFDVTTDATPDEIEKVFQDHTTVTIGKIYGTIGVVVWGELVEVTTFRVDLDYIDGRRPEGIHFTRSLKEDLARRDFTINAMAMDIDGNIHDYWGGREDLKNQLITTVGDPYERFTEDKLRILRGVRFASRLGFTIEDKTYKAIIDTKEGLNQVSVERIREELNKILLSDEPSKGMDLLVETGLMEYIIPEILVTVGYDQMSPYHHRSLFKHMTCTMDRVRPVLHLRLAALLHDISKPETLTIEDGVGRFFGHDKLGADLSREILKRLKYDNKTIKKVQTLIGNHMQAQPEMGTRGLKRQIKRVGEDLIFDLYELMLADMYCTRPGRDDGFLQDRIREIETILEEDQVVDTSGLVIDGNDLINIGYIQGVELGQMLDYLTELVIDDESLNSRDRLLEIAKEKLGEL